MLPDLEMNGMSRLYVICLINKLGGSRTFSKWGGCTDKFPSFHKLTSSLVDLSCETH